MPTSTATSSVLLLSSLALLLGACASVPDRTLSKEKTPYAALVTGKDPLDPSQFVAKVGTVFSSHEDLIRYYEAQRGRPLSILLLSGGGQNGAFGAGVLKGWRASGTRPEFDLVTGVSTGALLATHAFLGTSADDAVLEEIFTGVTSSSIYSEKGALSILSGGNSLLSTAPLEALIANHITAEVLERVAAEHARGRGLWVGATNLDYNQTWAWNLSLIAASGDPDALSLYRKVLQASAAFPIMFPPVEINGHLFADGAVRGNILIPGLSGENPPGPAPYGPGTVYVVQNGQAQKAPTPVKNSVIDLAGTTLGEMMHSSMVGLMARAYFAATIHGYDFRTVSVPNDVDIGNNPLAFDQEQMRTGFEAGYKLGRQPQSWLDVPPLIGDYPPWAVDLIREKL